MYINYAFNYYVNFILNKKRFDALQQYNFKINGSIHSIDWEIFCAILFKSKKDKVSDLTHYEIKSALKGNSFEYQYHKNSGIEKLTHDKKINHVYVVYANDYKDIDVYILNFNIMKHVIKKWKCSFKNNYKIGKQRYRKSITYNFMKSHSTCILKIRDGKLV